MTTRTVAQEGSSRPAGGGAICLDGVHKTFGKVEAVRGLDLHIEPGEVVAFLGPNGAGKTTTIDMLLGLSSPTKGSVQTFGMTPRQSVERGLVAAVMQTGGLLRDLTVAETVQLTASLFAQTRSPMECLERAGIAGIADHKVGKCSGGEQQRLRFAMALVSDPALIVLDEPTTGMDVTGRRDFWTAIRSDAERGRTVLFATHYLEEADLYADRIVMVRHGQIVADGTSAQIKALTTGRTVRATMTPTYAASVRGLPGVEAIDVRGDNVTITTRDSDAVARHLLQETDAHDVEIVARGLDEAFVALTTDSADATEEGTRR